MLVHVLHGLYQSVSPVPSIAQHMPKFEMPPKPPDKRAVSLLALDAPVCAMLYARGGVACLAPLHEHPHDA